MEFRPDYCKLLLGVIPPGFWKSFVTGGKWSARCAQFYALGLCLLGLRDTSCMTGVSVVGAWDTPSMTPR
jgi:hypothetical protein